MTVTLPADVETDVISYLRGHADVIAALGIATGQPNVATTMRGPFPMVQIIGSGGPLDRRQHVANLTVNVWGAPDSADADRATVKTAAKTVIAALLDRAGLIRSGVAVSWVTVPVALAWLPDGGQGRFTSNVVLFSH